MTEFSAQFFTKLMLESNDEPLAQQWSEQREAEWCKEASNRAALLESLIIRHDWEACRNWIDLWESEDSADELETPSADPFSQTEQ